MEPLFRYPPASKKREFESVFKCPFMAYWSPLYGFDVVQFDEKVIKSEEGCMRDEIVKVWGKEAANLVEYLINYR